jgi:hypothetical protein
MADDVKYLQIALEEMQDLYKRQSSSFDTIKTTVRSVLMDNLSKYHRIG